MSKKILFNSKDLRYGFMSNFYPSPFLAPFGKNIVLFRSVEHYYQAHKTKSKEFRSKIINAVDGAKAKYWGSAKSGCPLVKDFEKSREKIMREGLRYKFAQNPMLLRLLQDTAESTLVEDAPWDDFFGTGKDGKGKNVQGKLLMSMRDKGFATKDYRPSTSLEDLKVYLYEPE